MAVKMLHYLTIDCAIAISSIEICKLYDTLGEVRRLLAQ
ncbi:hypothetical protein NIES2104_60060 [Leptolyngbya sp. NIES-2104]|nr:hypothetical protein NIES2104_60060 [Leptolyngbya sp. NIES-2104]